MDEEDTLRKLLFIEYQLNRNRTPFLCDDRNCKYHGTTVVSHCGCYNEKLAEHRKAVREALGLRG